MIPDFCLFHSFLFQPKQRILNQVVFLLCCCSQLPIVSAANDPIIQVIRPLKGVSIPVGQSASIEWIVSPTASLNLFNISLWKNDKDVIQFAASIGTQVSSTSYAYKISSSIPSGEYQIVVEAIYPMTTDCIQGWGQKFLIKGVEIRIVPQPSLNQLVTGSDFVIKWSSFDPANVIPLLTITLIEKTNDGNYLVELLTDVANNGNYTLSIPSYERTNYYFYQIEAKVAAEQTESDGNLLGDLVVKATSADFWVRGAMIKNMTILGISPFYPIRAGADIKVSWHAFNPGGILGPLEIQLLDTQTGFHSVLANQSHLQVGSIHGLMQIHIPAATMTGPYAFELRSSIGQVGKQVWSRFVSHHSDTLQVQGPFLMLTSFSHNVTRGGDTIPIYWNQFNPENVMKFVNIKLINWKHQRALVSNYLNTGSYQWEIEKDIEPGDYHLQLESSDQLFTTIGSTFHISEPEDDNTSKSPLGLTGGEFIIIGCVLIAIVCAIWLSSWYCTTKVERQSQLLSPLQDQFDQTDDLIVNGSVNHIDPLPERSFSNHYSSQNHILDYQHLGV